MWAAGLILTSAAWAGYADAYAEGGLVVVNEKPVMRSRAAWQGSSPAQRATSAALILSSATAPDVVAEPPSVLGTPGVWGLTLGGRLFYTVNAQEAASQSSTAEGLAKTWARHINDALRSRPLEVSAQELIMPPDKPGLIQLTGSQARAARLQLANPQLGRFIRTRGQIRFEPRATGETVLAIQGETASATVVLRVLPYAGRPAAGLTAQVMGQGAPTSAVLQAAAAAFRKAGAVRSDTKFEVVSTDAAPLSEGASAVVRVRGQFSGEGLFPFESVAEVRVSNVGAVPQDAEVWYSNDPENLVGSGPLYWGALTPGKAVRLLTHHKNTLNRPLAIQYSVANPNPTPVRMALMMGEGLPSLNPTLAGYQAGDEYLELWQRRAAEVITIPANGAVPIQVQTLAPEITASALGTLMMLDQGPLPLVLEGRSLDPSVIPAPWRAGGKLPWMRFGAVSQAEANVRLTGSPAKVFAPALKREEFRFESNGRFVWLRIGARPIAGVEGEGQLSGNFGVVYQIAATLANPTDKPARIQVIFESSAGYNGALFLINGAFNRQGMVLAKEKRTLVDTVLAPGEERPLSIVTIPLSGASYPATIIVRPYMDDSDEIKDDGQ
jgi:hypothetical protein